MSSSKVVGRLRAVLGLDKRNFQQGLRDGENDLKRFSSVAQAVGGRLKMALGLSVAGIGLQQLASQAAAAVQSVAAIGDEAKRSGMSLKAFQEWKFVAEQNRIGIDAVVDGFKELNLRADEFIETGGGSASDAFKRLGFSAQDLKKKLKDPSALMLEIIGRLEGLDKAAQIRISDELFGGAGGEQFLQLLDQGEAGVRKIISRAHEVGAVMDADMIGKAQELDAKFKELGGAIDNLWKRGVVGAAQFFGFVNERLNDLLTEGEGREILGPELYTGLAQIGTLTDEQVEKVRLLKGAYAEMALQAVDAADALVITITAMDEGALRDALIAASLELRRLGQGFREGKVSATELRDGVEGVRAKTAEAVAALSEADRVAFSSVIGQVGALATALDGPIGRAKELWGWLQRAAGLDPTTKTGKAAVSRNPYDVSSTPPMESSIRPRMPGVDSYGNWQEENKPDGGKGGGGGKSRDEYAAAIESSRQQVAMLTAETAAFLAAAASGGKYGGSVDYAKKKAELLMAAQKQGLTITPALTAEIDAQARAYATAGLAAKEAADRLREIDEAMERGEDSARDFFGALLDGSDAAKNAIISLLAEMAKAQFASGALGLLGSFGGGGFLKTFGTLLGGGIPVGANSTGTLNWRGGLSRVNELGGEILDLPEGTRVIPADVSKRMADQSGAQAVDVHVTVGMDESGNLQVRSIARQEASSVAGELNRALPARIAEINARNPRMRG